MICYNCGYKQNSDDAQKCRVCGADFASMCSRCGSSNPKLARFCFNCGSNMETKAADMDDSGKLSENRKSVAVIFADISGFTSISEKLDPEEVRKIINDCFQYITKPVYELEGTIDKYMGDCVMILFGARYTHNDDAYRAVKCAMRMLKRIEEFSDENKKRLGTELSLSIGVNYGLVVTGRVGNSYDDDYTVMGDVVNTAQRLQTSAGRGNILVSGSVFEETEDLIHYSAMKLIKVKNKEKAVECHTPVSLVTGSAKQDENLIARIEELEVLNRAYEYRSSLNRITVTGESGLGKTTLVRTFIAARKDEIKTLWINCNAVSKERPYSTISSILSAILNIDPNDTTRIKTNRLRSFLDYILRDQNEETIIRCYNFIALIMGLDRDPDYAEIINAMQYQDLDREIKNQAAVFFMNLDRKQHLVIIIDDMHLADRESHEVLAVSDAFPGFFVFISQYQDSVQDGFGNVLELKRFTYGETCRLMGLMLETDDIDDEFMEGIYRITDGNPMFVHEIMQTIKKKSLFHKKGEKAYIEKDSLENLPKSLRNTILRNISELDDASVKFLRIASAVGNSFNLSWVMDILGDDEDESQLMEIPLKLNIIEFDTIRKTTEISDKVYSFTQDTIREVIYDSMLNEEKAMYHNKIAGRIEEKYKKELENYFEILGLHYLKGGTPRLAKQYLLKSADKLKQNYIYKGAVEYYDRYMELEKVSDKPSENNRLVNAMISKAEVLVNISDYDTALDCLDQAEQVAIQGEHINSIKIMKANVLKETAEYDLALEILDKVEPVLGTNSNLFGKALQLRCAIYIVKGNQGVIELVEKSEKILLKTRDYSSLAETMSQAGIKHFFSGNPGEAIEYFEKALGYAKKANNQGILSRILINMGIIYHATGETDKSFVYLSDSMEAAEKISNIKGYLSAEINLGIFYMEKGLFSKAVSLFDDAISKSREISLFYQTCLALLNKADAEYEAGNYESAENLYKESLSLSEKYNMAVETGLNNLGIAKSEISRQIYGDVRDYLEKSLKIFKDAEELPSVGDYHYYSAIYLYDCNEMEEALAEIEKSIGIAKKTNEDVKLTKAVRKKGDIMTVLGMTEEALEAYDESVGLSENLGSFYEMAKSYFSRYRLHVCSDRRKEAADDLEKAVQYINEIDYCKWTDTILDESYGTE